ncbi:S8 family peptidase [Bacillus sp. FJAT-44742]|uniref:S8 family peptidase n=1 Tax=Bacillus sp. FJAT-44742 TaxID=2014005 RepID=UPI000C24AC36|nr:S8 family peptidase [Bacillus sp. FJAT-44742]
MSNDNMVNSFRSYSHKLDPSLRENLLFSYQPLNRTPRFLRVFYERFISKTKKLSVIVEFDKEQCTKGLLEVEEIIQHHKNCKMNHHFTRISCCSANITPAALQDMLSRCSSIKKVHLNREIKALLNTAIPAAKAKSVKRDNTVLTGKGITTAIIDTGVYPHEDLTGRIIDFADFINERTEPYDDNGHGTHCAGAVAGNGLASNEKYKGPAPESNIIGVKVLDKMGAGSLETVMLGVEWCIEYNEKHPNNKIDIINLSLGSPAQRFDNEEEDPLVRIVNEAWDQGIVVCAAAGNDGPKEKTISSPGVSEKVITVGALDDKDTASRKDNEVADFSSRGPTPYGKAKPDILAPGVDIISLRSPLSYIDRLQKHDRVENDYFTMSGTSMATPICAGVVALLLQHNPELTPQQVKKMILEGADMWRDKDPNVYGSGYINAENSISQ